MKVITRELDFLPEYDLRSICPLEEMLLFDIETTGLKKETTQVYLIGCCYYSEDVWHVRQYLTENGSDEYYILDDFLSFASGFKTLLHFNGDGFDIPYINYKAEQYFMPEDLKGHRSVDIYREIKCARKLLGLPSLSQKSVETFLGIERDDQYNGGLLIPVYYDYEKTGASDLEELLLLHNFDDIQGMLKILPVLSYGKVFAGEYIFRNAEETFGSVIFEYQLKYPVPVDRQVMISYGSPDDIEIFAGGDLLRISMKVSQAEGKIPVSDISDYYYLPEEDMVIHKDVARFVDRKSRVRATKKNGFLKKQGKYIPDLTDGKCTGYYIDINCKKTFADVEEIMLQGDNVFMHIADAVIRNVK